MGPTFIELASGAPLMPARPGPWDLLDRPNDPVVADVEAIDARLTYFRSLADSMRVEGSRLSQIASGDSLAGNYANELRSASGAVAKDLDQVVGRYEAVVQALNLYEPEVEVALSGSLSALDAAIDANAAAQQAAGLPTAAPTPGAALSPEQTQANQDKTSAASNAAEQLSDAKSSLSGVLDRLDDAGRQAASIIRRSFNDGLTDSTWQRFKYAFAKFLKILVKVLTYVGMALAVIALVIPGLGEAIFAAGMVLGAVVLAADVTLKAMGQGSWADIGIAVAGLLTLGAAKFLGPALQSGLRSALGSMRASFGSAASAADEAGSAAERLVGNSTEEEASDAAASQASTSLDDATDVEGTGEGDDQSAPTTPGDEDAAEPPTDAEQQALTDYLGGGAHPMNSYLRTAGRIADPEMDANVARVASALRKLPAQEGWSTAFRGVTGRLGGNLARGDTFVDQGFMSTTTDREVAQDFGLTGGTLGAVPVGGDSTLFTVYSEDIARDVSSFTGLGEGEMLFPPGTEWEVAGVKSLPEIVRVNGGETKIWGVTLKMPGMDIS